MATIFHITTREQWRLAVANGHYTHESLSREGFIHSSTSEQVTGVANTRFAGQDGLVLLCIEPNDVTPDIHYESPPDSDEQYPHIYGPLNLNAVREVVDFPPSADGSFSLPRGLND